MPDMARMSLRRFILSILEGLAPDMARMDLRRLVLSILVVFYELWGAAGLETSCFTGSRAKLGQKPRSPDPKP